MKPERLNELAKLAATWCGWKLRQTASGDLVWRTSENDSVCGFDGLRNRTARGVLLIAIMDKIAKRGILFIAHNNPKDHGWRARAGRHVSEEAATLIDPLDAVLVSIAPLAHEVEDKHDIDVATARGEDPNQKALFDA